jgi:predicted acylesterase/phospholipase RssA/CRP-like cAMP-binding protein
VCDGGTRDRNDYEWGRCSLSGATQDRTLFDRLLELRLQGGPLARLTEQELREFEGDLEEIQCDAEDVLILHGEAVDRVFIVLEGRLVACVAGTDGGEKIVRELVPGDLLGVGALLAGGTHSAEVRATETCSLAVLSREAFDTLLDRDSATWEKISEMVLAWMRQSQLSTYLSEIFGVFESADRDILRRLESDVEIRTLAGGEALFQQGDQADAAYIVMNGRLRVITEGENGDERVLNELGRGEVLGELALLTASDRSATVYAVRDTDVARISKDTFHWLIEQRPQSLHSLSRVMADRLQRHTHVQVPQHRRGLCTALVALNPSVSLQTKGLKLVSRLAKMGSVAVLGSTDVDAALGREGIAQSADDDPTYLRLSRWLHEREENYRYVLYLADPTWTTWTERCVRQADRVLYLADADSSPEQTEIEAKLASRWQRDRAPRKSLVLLHPADRDRPRGTARWLDERDVDVVYHIRRDHAGDMERLARWVGDRAVGLVCGGGGARGGAHLGVLKAMEELGVPVDMIGGSSIGSPVAAPTAMGDDPEEALKKVCLYFDSLLDYTLPVASLLAGRRISASIEAGAGDWDIEDLWLPYFCISTNLTTGRSVTHRRGNLARAMRASVSIPGVLPPVPEGEELLADGGILNNLPIDVMRRLNPGGVVIAVDVLPPRGPRAKADYGLGVSGWGLAMNKMLPWRRSLPVPSLTGTIMRSMFVGSDRVRAEMLRDGLADFYLNIRASGVGFLRFDQMEKAAGIGYEASIGPLREWLEGGGLSER